MGLLFVSFLIRFQFLRRFLYFLRFLIHFLAFLLIITLIFNNFECHLIVFLLYRMWFFALNHFLNRKLNLFFTLSLFICNFTNLMIYKISKINFSLFNHLILFRWSTSFFLKQKFLFFIFTYPFLFRLLFHLLSYFLNAMKIDIGIINNFTNIWSLFWRY